MHLKFIENGMKQEINRLSQLLEVGLGLQMRSNVSCSLLSHGQRVEAQL